MIGREIERPLQRILPTDHRLLWNAEDQINADVFKSNHTRIVYRLPRIVKSVRAIEEG